MRQFSRGFAGSAFVVAVAALAACQGNIGGGSGLSIPQAPGYQQPAGPGGGGSSQSRERLLEGAVYLSSKLTSVPLPQLAGYAVTIALGTPGPIASPTVTPAGAKERVLKALGHTAGSRAVASPSPAPSLAASSSPEPTGSGSAVPSPTGSASASASASPGASALPSPKGSHAASPSPSGSSLPRIDTKTTVYPDEAPPPPTPMPTGEVQTFVKRSAIVRGYVQMGTDVPLYGLGAVHFTLPSSELTPKRGFTVALYESGKHNHNRLLNYDTEPLVENDVVYSSQADPIVLKKGSGYLLMIYGDDEPAPAATVAPGFPSPGNNPFPMPSGSVQPGYTQAPYPGGYSPTPYPVFGTPHP